MAEARTIKGIAFDAYGTLFDVYSIGALADEIFPGDGKALAELWRDRQIEYTRIRTSAANMRISGPSPATRWRLPATGSSSI